MSVLLKTVFQININRIPLMKIRHYGAGAVKDAGGAFAKKGDSEENAYFYKLQKEQLDKLKGFKDSIQSF